MLTRLREHFGSAGLIVAIIALVAALAGGAIAAQGGSGDRATASAKAKKGPQGPRGPRGKAGPAGAAGPVGPQGPAGPGGPKGDTGGSGSNGDDGANGTSVTNTKLNPGNINCPAGGAEFKVGAGASSYACNGEEGPEGPEGPEGKTGFAAQLPPSETELGAWSTDAVVTTQGSAYTTISFPFPLPAGGYAVHYVTSEEVANDNAPADCPGSAEAPEAEEGAVCVYQVAGFGLTFLAEWNPENGAAEAGAGKVGVILQFSADSNAGFNRGTWAATAE